MVKHDRLVPRSQDSASSRGIASLEGLLHRGEQANYALGHAGRPGRQGNTQRELQVEDGPGTANDEGPGTLCYDNRMLQEILTPYTIHTHNRFKATE